MTERVHVEGLNEFTRALRESEAVAPKELAVAHKKVAKIAEEASRFHALSMGGMQAHFYGSIRAQGTQSQAAVSVQSKANAAFWGAKKHAGWYAAPQYRGGPPQFPEWVGAGWETGGPGGPYAINPAIRESLPVIEHEFSVMVDRMTRPAFPE